MPKIFSVFVTGDSQPADSRVEQHIARRNDAQVTVSSSWESGRTAVARLNACEDDIHVFVEGAPRWDDGTCGTDAAIRILRNYRTGGEQFVESMYGSFALAIVDMRQKVVLLAVDRMGIRSLYFARGTNGEIVIGPGGGAVAGHAAIQAHIRRQALFDYMYFHMVPAPDTVFEGVTKLRPAHVVVLDTASITTRRYWDPVFQDESDMTSAALEAEVRGVLRRSVERCVPDERTGAFLSGGLDSSSVVGMLAEVSGASPRTFSIGFAADGYDESKYARIAARHFHADAHEAILTPRHIVEAVPLLATAYDEPFGNSSAVPTYFCAKLAASAGVSRLLAGDGGDEIFAGNPHYTRQLLFERYWQFPRIIREKVFERLLMPAIPAEAMFPFNKIKSYVEQARIPLPLRLRSWDYMFRQTPESIFTGEFLGDLQLDHPADVMAHVYREPRDIGTLNRLLYFDWEFVLADNDLQKVNRGCELAGVEVCYPMLDQEMLDFALRVPKKIKIRRGELRHYYKNAMTGFLPQEIIKKKKQGFGLPFGLWLKTSQELQDLVYPSLDALRDRHIFVPAFLDRVVQEHREGHASYHGYVIWDLLMLEVWLSAHDVSL